MKELSAKQGESSSQAEDYEIKLNRLQIDTTNWQSRFKQLETKEQASQKKNDELSAMLTDKSKNISGLQLQEAKFLSQIQGYQNRISELEKQKDEFYEKNRFLYNDNKFLKEKVESYPKRLSQVSILKDRLLKENAVLHYNLGVFHIQRQEYSEAIIEFEKVLELTPNDPATHYNLGLIYAEYLNDKPKAMIHFKRYLMTTTKDDKDADRAKKYILTWEKWQEQR